MIDKALTEFGESRPDLVCANCAVKTLNKMATALGMDAEDSVLVAGFAGGVGLLGNVFGALAVGVFAMSVSRYLEHETKKRDSRIRGSLQELSGANFRGSATQLRLAFIDRFDSELCIQITQRQFQDIENRSAFIGQGGCQEVSEYVANWVEGQSAIKRP